MLKIQTFPSTPLPCLIFIKQTDIKLGATRKKKENSRQQWNLYTLLSKLPLKLTPKWTLGLLNPGNVYQANSAKQVLARKREIQLSKHKCLVPFEKSRYGLRDSRCLHRSPPISANPMQMSHLPQGLSKGTRRLRWGSWIPPTVLPCN